MTVGILCEKPSAARAMAKALGGTKGNYQGEAYVITHARGHLYELAQPEEQVPAAKKDQYKSWNLELLPWDHTEMEFKQVPIKGAAEVIRKVRSDLGGVDEIAIATDIDPSGEGDAIAWNALIELNLHRKPVSRMEFTDESPSSFQKAFKSRRAVTSMEDEGVFRKAQYRNRWDFLSMQFTRIATVSAAQRAVLRQGRLKSAMLLLTGDQLKAHHDYVKKPFFQNRFRDENQVMYINSDEPRFDAEADVPTDALAASKVAVDSRQMKYTKPPRLLDLAGLSARLSSKSFKADDVLSIYQRMYEDQVVSYPRTEDKHITTEQFNEMLPKVNDIAGVLSVDPAVLTVRTPRKSHVKDSGAHGANRPGPTVPSSLDAVEQKYGKLGRLIYEELGRSFLAMFASDYAYEAQVGHVEDFPKFVGRAAVPKELGWKEIFDSGEDADDEESAQGLGTQAEPFVFEGANKRPEHPTMKWLMKQLERREVGTGATRTSTYADVTNAKAKFPLMAEKRGRITLSEFGEMGYRLLPGTRIGDLSATEQVFATMDKVASGQTTIDEELGQVAEWVRHDIEVMESNAEAMRTDLGLEVQAVAKEKASGTFEGEQVEFSREWGGHRFTDAEIEKLLAGEEIEITGTSKKTGKPFGARGRFEEQSYKGKQFFGFKMLDFVDAKDANGKSLADPKDERVSGVFKGKDVSFKRVWSGHRFTDAEVDKLLAGDQISFEATSKRGSQYTAKGKLEQQSYNGNRFLGFKPDFK